MKYKKSIMTTFTILTLVGSNSLVSADQLKGLKPYEKIEFSKIFPNRRVTAELSSSNSTTPFEFLSSI